MSGCELIPFSPISAWWPNLVCDTLEISSEYANSQLLDSVATTWINMSFNYGIRVRIRLHNALDQVVSNDVAAAQGHRRDALDVAESSDGVEEAGVGFVF